LQTVHDSYFIETYLVDNSDRDSSEGPEKSTVGDRNDGIREVEVPGVNSNHPPFST